MDFNRLKEQVALSLAKTLPGEAAQFQMAPLARATLPIDDATLAGAVKSSVLVLIYPKNKLPHTVLIKRNEYAGVHSAQVSFPGGRFEPHDPDLQHTALREASEEIGLQQDAVDVVGQLSRLYIPPSHFLVQPFVGFHDLSPQFTPDPKEVAHIIELELNTLLDERLVQTRAMELSSGVKTEVPYFAIHGHIVWGATAMILSELKVILNEVLA